MSAEDWQAEYDRVLKRYREAAANKDRWDYAAHVAQERAIALAALKKLKLTAGEAAAVLDKSRAPLTG